MGVDLGSLEHPGPAELDLWWFPVPEDRDFVADASFVITEGEAERAGRIRDASALRRYLAGRWALRGLLGGYLGKEPFEVPIRVGPNGKPQLGEGQRWGLTFNLSHSGDWVLLAFGSRRSVGVDLEAVAHFAHLEEVAARVLTGAESRELLAVPCDLRPDAFFRAWTRKEALVKAVGTGLTEDATRIPAGLGEPGPADGREVVVTVPGVKGVWSVGSVDAPHGYRAAVATMGAPLGVRGVRRIQWAGRGARMAS